MERLKEGNWKAVHYGNYRGVYFPLRSFSFISVEYF